ncbi:rhodanese-like domain-containing protein [Actinocorallia sp. A-T 12471]|uniref:rhodanese-like domain-containing protein n=1 Tax=Actinocorallia sp. A-T 12471 TaxID=3089813 RepID=UPI0029D21801|nr:rhodanese-like domain-containing protein [Actinocorallia sp. A-T 12471]MDX6739141.1 rhodanese-like domain-containing protein [Actinocorallia sp. A-T 12471]
MRIVDPAGVRALGAQVLLLDVRGPAEFAAVRIPGSVNVPLDALPGALDAVARHAAGRPVVLVCRSGARARQAARLVPGDVLDGGVEAWASSGNPVERPTAGRRTPWSLERQVRFTAGSLVAVSAAASLVWQPALAVAAAVGVGLAVAGATDTCLMGRALALLPFNR